jgi:phosphoglycolate phosphatase-like HAD superfamily hydrolase
MIYIFDIDGTIADISHRLLLIQGETKNWEAFYKMCVNDKPIFEVITVARALSAAGHTIVYSTGRASAVYNETRDWLIKYRLPDSMNLYMRPDGDHREDSVVKCELLTKINGDHANEKLGGIFEDRQQAVDAYRAQGVRVFQVAEGKF